MIRWCGYEFSPWPSLRDTTKIYGSKVLRTRNSDHMVMILRLFISQAYTERFFNFLIQDINIRNLHSRNKSILKFLL